MFCDYLIVGPTLELRSTFHRDPRVLPPDPILDFRITRRTEVIGRALVRMFRDGFELRVEGTKPIPTELLIEVYRLLARVVCLETDNLAWLYIPSHSEHSALAPGMAVDGFTAAGTDYLSRAPGPLRLADSEKPDRDFEIYSHPFHVPWNIVPREWEVLFRLIAEFPAPSNSSGPTTRRPVRILDLGCGYGKNATGLEDLGYRVYGLDLSLAAIVRSRQLVRNPDRFIVASATALPWSDASFDCALDIGCLHCMAPLLRDVAVREIARVLRPGGVLFSRSFKPKPETWVRNQPFRIDSFGISTEEAIRLLEPHFQTTIWQDDPARNYVRAAKPADASNHPHLESMNSSPVPRLV